GSTVSETRWWAVLRPDIDQNAVTEIASSSATTTAKLAYSFWPTDSRLTNVISGSSEVGRNGCAVLVAQFGHRPQDPSVEREVPGNAVVIRCRGGARREGRAGRPSPVRSRTGSVPPARRPRPSRRGQAAPPQLPAPGRSRGSRPRTRRSFAPAR